MISSEKAKYIHLSLFGREGSAKAVSAHQALAAINVARHQCGMRRISNSDVHVKCGVVMCRLSVKT